MQLDQTSNSHQIECNVQNYDCQELKITCKVHDTFNKCDDFERNIH